MTVGLYLWLPVSQKVCPNKVTILFCMHPSTTYLYIFAGTPATPSRLINGTVLTHYADVVSWWPWDGQHYVQLTNKSPELNCYGYLGDVIVLILSTRFRCITMSTCIHWPSHSVQTAVRSPVPAEPARTDFYAVETSEQPALASGHPQNWSRQNWRNRGETLKM